MTVTLRGRSVLIVEDSPTQAMALEVVVTDAGMVAETARTAEEAISMVQRRTFDLVVTDVVMPGMSGYELCRALKADQRTRHIPVILLTSLADPLEIMRALACGADNFVTKPYDGAVLLARATRVFEGNERSRRGRTGVVDLTVLGSHFQISAEKEQILELLVSNFEELVRANNELRAARAEAEAARHKAEEANKAKSEFLSMMSHDLRTPLNAIGGYAELLVLGVRGELNEAQAKDMARIRRNSKHLLALVNDVLSFARIEQGDIPLRIERVRLDEAVRGLGAMIEPQAMSKKLRYRFECDDQTLFVRADPERLEQIIVNLLANATRFTADGGEIVMQCKRSGDSGVVSVTDTGIGIPPEKLATIFDPFVQVDQGRVGTREGVGLGLTISRTLATRMDGDVTVTSTPGQGSTFSLILPLDLSPGAARK